MATNIANEEEGNSQIKRNLNNWKYPKIPIDQVYKKKILKISASYAVKDYEDTISVNGNDRNISGSLVSSDFLKGFIKKQHKFVHLGLVQIAIKPLFRDGLGAPIVVSLRDARFVNFHNSLLALVKANLSQGPVYFNCFPSFSVSLDDASLFDVLTLDVETGGIPLALAYRIVCKAMVDLSPEALQEPVLGETAYFQPRTGTRGTTIWDESKLQVHESSTSKQESEAQDEDLLHTLPDNHLYKKGTSISTKLASEKEGSSLNKTKLDDWKYDKIPVDRVYNISLRSKAKKLFKIFSTVKDYEKTITLKAANQINISFDLIKAIFKGRKDGYVHLGLVQIAVKPLMSDGVGAPIIACLRDTRFIKFEDSLLALVQANLSQGPFYFNCCPGFLFPFCEIHSVLNLHVVSGVPLVLTYRLVCNVTSDLTFSCRDSLVLGETTYYQPSSEFERTTKWDEVQVPKSWIQCEPHQAASGLVS